MPRECLDRALETSMKTRRRDRLPRPHVPNANVTRRCDHARRPRAFDGRSTRRDDHARRAVTIARSTHSPPPRARATPRPAARTRRVRRPSPWNSNSHHGASSYHPITYRCTYVQNTHTVLYRHTPPWTPRSTRTAGFPRGADRVRSPRDPASMDVDATLSVDASVVGARRARSFALAPRSRSRA